MARIALYRKYRPQTFDDLYDQDHVKTILKNQILGASFSHAYLLSGPRGVGKTSVARILAKALNCAKPKDGNPCNICSSCKEISDQTALDVIEIDAASNRGIDEIRDLREKVKFGPSSLKYKVFIIDEVHMLTREAFNALLKTLEEPPEHAIFVLATTEFHKIPSTVISRCQRFDFKKISDSALSDRLKEISKLEKISIDEDAIKIIASASDGGLRDAISIFDQITQHYVDKKTISKEDILGSLGLIGEGKLKELYESIRKKEKKKALDNLIKLLEDGADIGQLAKSLSEYFRKEIHKELENDKNVDDLTFAVETLSECYRAFKTAFVPQLMLEVAILKIINYDGIKVLQDAKPEAVSVKQAKAQKEISTEKINPEENNHSGSDEASPNIDKWPQVLFEIKQKNHSIHAFLRAAEADINGDTIFLKFPYKFHKERIEERKNREIVETAAEKIFGSKVSVKCILDGGSKTVAQDQPAKKEKSDDKLKEYMDILGGELI